MQSIAPLHTIYDESITMKTIDGEDLWDKSRRIMLILHSVRFADNKALLSAQPTRAKGLYRP